MTGTDGPPEEKEDPLVYVNDRRAVQPYEMASNRTYFYPKQLVVQENNFVNDLYIKRLQYSVRDGEWNKSRAIRACCLRFLYQLKDVEMSHSLIENMGKHFKSTYALFATVYKNQLRSYYQPQISYPNSSNERGTYKQNVKGLFGVKRILQYEVARLADVTKYCWTPVLKSDSIYYSYFRMSHIMTIYNDLALVNADRIIDDCSPLKFDLSEKASAYETSSIACKYDHISYSFKHMFYLRIYAIYDLIQKGEYNHPLITDFDYKGLNQLYKEKYNQPNPVMADLGVLIAELKLHKQEDRITFSQEELLSLTDESGQQLPFFLESCKYKFMAFKRMIGKIRENSPNETFDILAEASKCLTA